MRHLTKKMALASVFGIFVFWTWNLVTRSQIKKPGNLIEEQISKQWERNVSQVFQHCFERFECDFQKVQLVPDRFNVYYAYYDDSENQRRIRVIAVGKNFPGHVIFCALAYRKTIRNSSSEMEWIIVPAVVQVIRENFGLPYSALFILCPLASLTVPAWVSLGSSFDKDTLPTVNDPVKILHVIPSGNLLAIANANKSVKDHEEIDPHKASIGVCVAPLYRNWSYTHRLIEFIELNRFLGVDHFTFYGNSVSRNAECLLEKYLQEGIVSLFPFHNSLKFESEIRATSLFASFNDCIYRLRFRHDYLLIIDVDEFIVPDYQDTLADLISTFNTIADPKTTAAFIFENNFFALQCEDGKQTPALESELQPYYTFKKTLRRVHFHPFGIRSKFIVRPRRIDEVGNHFIFQHAEGQKSFFVNTKYGFSHHYRVTDDGCVSPLKEDLGMHRYKTRFLNRIPYIKNQLQSCSLV